MPSSFFIAFLTAVVHKGQCIPSTLNIETVEAKTKFVNNAININIFIFNP